MTMVDGRRARGSRSRASVMRVAVNLASVGGLDALSIGALAAGTEISKSGIVALFGAKEQLQLATIAAAREIFISEVITPTLAARGGITRLQTLIDSWLAYSRTRVFAGGCFFAAATVEFASKVGPVRDAVALVMDEWYEFVNRTIRSTRDRGDLAADVDVDVLAFEITALLDSANSRSLMTRSETPYVTAAQAIGARIAQLSA